LEPSQLAGTVVPPEPLADVAVIDPTWGRLDAYQARGLACAGCGRSFLESQKVAGQWIGPLDAIVVGLSPVDGFDLMVCQDCDELTDCRGAREFECDEIEVTS
jgi:hypothetical protein